ncbi:MAG: PQQ-binding-like beta-propeller repeat protein [Myxococcota bacterium]
MIALFFGLSILVQNKAYGGQGEPVPNWVTKLPKTTSLNSEFSKPILHGSHVYVGSSQEAGVLIFERSSGALVNKLKADAPVQSHVQFHNGSIYLADTAGTVYRFKKNGKLVWKRATQAPILSQLTIESSRLLVQNVDDVLLALNLDTGDLIWRYAHKTDISRRRDMTLYGASVPFRHKEFIYAGFSDGAIVQLKSADGGIENIRWIGEGRYPDIIAAPSIIESQLIVSGAESPLSGQALSLQDEYWQLDVGSNHSVTELDEDGFLHSGSDGVLRAIEKRTGAELWSWDSEIQAALSEPILSDMGIIVSSSGGTVYCIDPETHNLRWQFQPDYHISGLQHSPVIDGRDIVWLSNHGFLYAFRFPEPEHKSCPGVFCNWMTVKP